MHFFIYLDTRNILVPKKYNGLPDINVDPNRNSVTHKNNTS